MRRHTSFLFALLAACLLPFTVLAYQELPTDPSVKIGKLENGLTYYLRSNSKPENRIEFRLAVKAGSIVEDDDQQGLAHFSEHMLFNGTKNFEKNELINFLQKMGLEFGGDLNAYTSFDETVYILPIPTDEPENLDKALTVLSDWAHNATFDNEEIDKERGVVMEEWRLRLGAYERMRQQIWPVTLAGSRYAERLPIGKPEILENFDYEAAKRFYKDWYRPDLMGVVAVGDFDTAEMEAKIKSYFGTIKNPEKPRERKYYGFPDFEGTRIAIASDEEGTQNTISVNFITPGTVDKDFTKNGFRKGLIRGLYSQMLNQRLSDLTREENPPFQFSYSSYGGTYGKDKNAYTIYVSVSDGKFDEGLTAAMRENERVRRFGFTESELQRTKLSYRNSYERRAKEADKVESWRVVNQYVAHFLNGGNLLSEQQQLALVEELINDISLDEVNGLIKNWLTEGNRTVEVMAKSENADQIPTEERILDIIDKVKDDSTIEAYAEETIADELITDMPTPGTIEEKSYDEATNVNTWKLSNGMTIYLKPTEFKNDEIRMSAFSFGGTSLYPDSEFWTASNASRIISQMGVGDFNAIDLRKFMTGKTASVFPFISSLEEGLNGSSSVKDAEYMFQMMHLYFTQARKDESAFNSWKSQQKNLYGNILSDPGIQFQIESQKILYDNHFRVGFPSPETFDDIDLDRVMDIYQDRFEDASDFKVVFVGNIDLDQFEQYINTYLASLSSTYSNESFKDIGLNVQRGQIEENIYAGVDDKSQVIISINGDYDYTLENNGLMNAIASILSNKMIETLREEMGGVYGAGASASPRQFPSSEFRFVISFPCKPENVEALTNAALEELEKIKRGEFTDEDVQKIVTARMQNFEEQIEQNSYWSSMMPIYIKSNMDIGLVLDGNKRAQAITKDAIIAAANKYLTKENMIKLVKLPADQNKSNLDQEIKK